MAPRVATSKSSGRAQAEPRTSRGSNESARVEAYGPAQFAEDFPGQEFGPGFHLSKPVGCDACDKSGYKGRLGIHELLVATDPLRHAVAEKSPVEKIRRLAIEGGMRALLQDGIAKVMFGLTDMKQVLAVCSR